MALHTDHCPKDKLDTYVKPLIAISTERVAKGGIPLFQSHMWDGSAVPLDENLEIAKELLSCAKANIILEIEIGVVGGEEDGVEAEINEKLYTSPEDFVATLDALGAGEKATPPPRRSATCTASTSPATSCCSPRSCATARMAPAKLGLAGGQQAVLLRLPRRFGLADRRSPPRWTTAS